MAGSWHFPRPVAAPDATRGCPRRRVAIVRGVTMATWELEAREQIRDTLANYTAAGDGYRLDELAAQFAEDGVLEVAGHSRTRGRSAIVEMLVASTQARRPAEGRFYLRHVVTNLRFVRLDEDRAETTSYFLVLTPAGADHWGRYRDVLVPVGDRWLFEHRLVTVDGHAPTSWYEAGQ